ncbi:MAG: flagellar hook-basal body complex protein, partial [Deferribacterales bacterium]|nr:flagellar hook-basal body complex protein [Deferribacterales bacterium]
GTLTNPSGYKVQGWMSDPVTGELNSDNTVGDIILGPEYKIMQAKASSEINLAGTLDTRATASTLTYQTFLTQAAAQQSFETVTNSAGVKLDLVSGEPVIITAHASGITLMSQLVDKNGTQINMSDGDGITFTFGNTPYTINYSAAGGQNRGDGKFNSVEEFIEEVNTIFKQVGDLRGEGPVASMSLVNGTFKLTANSTFELTSVSGDSSLQNILSSITGAYGPNNSKTSGEIFFAKTVKAMEDFDNLSELGLQVSNALNGNIVSDGFNVEFLENNFGMKEGEAISFNEITIYENSDGTGNPTNIQIGPFIYTEEENPVAANKFHTVQELAQLITDAINDGAVGAGAANPSIVNFGIIGNQITFNLQGGGAIRFGAAEMEPAPGGAEPNPYLKTVFDAAFTTEDASGTVIGKLITDTQSYINVDEISGKGRLIYSYNKTGNNLNLNMDTGDFNMVADDELIFVIGGTEYTVTYPAAGWADGAAFQGALNTALAGSGLTATYNPTGAADGTGILTFTANGANVVIDDIRTTSTSPDLKDLLKSRLKNVEVTAAGVTVEGQVPQVNAITGLSITKGYSGTIFTDNVIGENNNIGLDSSIASERFMTVADENTKMVDLFSGKGEPFSFTENESSLSFSASIGNEKVTNNNVFAIKVDTTYGELAAAMEEYLGLGRAHNSMENVVIKDGQLVVTGEKGVANNIDYFNITGSGSSNRYGIFNQYMKAESEGATGGTLSTNMAIYDEQGNAHIVNFKFSLWNEEQNEWRLQIDCDDPSNSIAINGATTNELVLKFNSDGSLAYIYDRFPTPSTVMVNPTLRFSAANGTNTISEIDLNLGSQGGTDGMVLAAAAGTFTQNSSDGYAQGNLESTLFNPAGEIVGSYTNGEVRTLGQIALATFVNYQGLSKIGDSLYAETGNSGQATVGKPQTGSRGDIAAGMLENSNVDLSMELVDMITTQRGFQSNSKVITTSDEMIQELLNMKR